ncbi:MAG: cation:proton antiporter [Chitinispirillaceae bacterium]|nr:cation:proton antiporter [Chitinispirillaceae bacterium]
MHFIATPPPLLAVGTVVFLSLFAGKLANLVKLPSLIGFMVIGVVAGPSLLNLLNEGFQNRLSFITEIALAFVAISIGLELSFPSLAKLGKSIIVIIFAESFGAFIVVFLSVFFLTRNMVMALIFGAVAPASAPAGTVAVIKEYRAKGPLTKALYTVVGFDDGLGIIIFGFAAAIARSLLLAETGSNDMSVLSMLYEPLVEIVGGILCGIILAALFSILGRRLAKSRDLFLLMFAYALILAGICDAFHFSIILTNMVFGMMVVNTQPHSFTHKIHDELSSVMPLLFILFFTLAGANLHISALPSLGILGIVYVVARTLGLVGGARIGAIIGRADENIRKYIGLGILSQAGVAIGLALIVKHEFGRLGAVNGDGVHSGELLGAAVITTVTATCIFFEIIGPILTKYALGKAGELREDDRQHSKGKIQ